MWGGDGGPGPCKDGHLDSQAEHQQSRPTLPSRGSPAPHPDCPTSPASHTHKCSVGGAPKAEKTWTSGQACVGVPSPEESGARSVSQGLASRMTTGPASLKHCSLEHSKLGLLIF